jgi:hypothetical protein
MDRISCFTPTVITNILLSIHLDAMKMKTSVNFFIFYVFRYYTFTVVNFTKPISLVCLIFLGNLRISKTFVISN